MAKCFYITATDRVAYLPCLTLEKIRLVAFDFDKTIVNIHTGGRWRSSADELYAHVRPEFQCLIGGCLDHGIHVAVATFSTQKDLVDDVLKRSIPFATRLSGDVDIPIFGGNDRVKNYRDGKQSQLLLAMDYFNKQRNDYSSGSPRQTPASTVLVDDDGRNIAVAQSDGYRTIHYDPSKSENENALTLDKV